MNIDSSMLPRVSLVILGAAFVGLCPPAVLGVKALRSPHRALSTSNEFLPSWAQNGLYTNTDLPDCETEAEKAVFWHIPQSGGGTVKNVYECMGRSIANRIGVLDSFGYGDENKLIRFKPFTAGNWTTVNVDLTTKTGILRAAGLGLAASDKADLLITPEASFAGQHLFDEQYKARYMAMFRHPVERLISKFDFLQTLQWLPTHHPLLSTMSLSHWASTNLGNMDKNFLVKKLNGKAFSDTVDETDLRRAKELLEHHFIVGLSSNITGSVDRFNTVMGLNENGIDYDFDVISRKCMNELHDKVEGFNNHAGYHQTGEGNVIWTTLAEHNALDVELYEFIQELYLDQEEVIIQFKHRSRQTQMNRVNGRKTIRALASGGRK